MERIDSFISKTKAKIIFGGAEARYNYKLDLIEVPAPDYFDSTTEFYAVIFHELIHWARHPHRLNSTLAYITTASPLYLFYRAYEEMVANIGEGLLCIRFGLNPDLSPIRAQLLADNFEKAHGTAEVITAALKRARRAVRYISNQ